ncbi:DUF559 domain-containing protein [Enterovirga rhinocerotis]|uniref:DUF559 domain-containing protein n=1 Tax=Enterovirga rhinocerotis TaxID=1339210 RepID=UPI0010622AEA
MSSRPMRAAISTISRARRASRSRRFIEADAFPSPLVGEGGPAKQGRMRGDDAPIPAQMDDDARRSRWLEAQGFRVLRFSNDLLLAGSGDLILKEIRKALARAPSSDPC